MRPNVSRKKGVLAKASPQGRLVCSRRNSEKREFTFTMFRSIERQVSRYTFSRLGRKRYVSPDPHTAPLTPQNSAKTQLFMGPAGIYCPSKRALVQGIINSSNVLYAYVYFHPYFFNFYSKKMFVFFVKTESSFWRSIPSM